MAKKINVEGVIFFPRKKNENIRCNKCGVVAPELIYAKGSDISEINFCGTCFQTMLIDYRRKLQKNPVLIDKEQTVYIGKAGHKCTEKESIFIPLSARFVRKDKSIDLFVLRCKFCDEIFVESKVYESHKEYFRPYKKIRTKTGKEIPDYDYEDYAKIKRVGYVSPKVKDNEIPESVKWAMSHPFQGGGCAPK